MNGMMHLVVCGLVVLGCLTPSVRAHGRMWEPVGRSTAWRKGFNTPKNFDDNALFCGGFSVSVCVFTLITPYFIYYACVMWLLTYKK